jgi:hypothetical protein
MTIVKFQGKVWGKCSDCEQEFYAAQEFTDHFVRAENGLTIIGCSPKPQQAQLAQGK